MLFHCPLVTLIYLLRKIIQLSNCHWWMIIVSGEYSYLNSWIFSRNYIYSKQISHFWIEGLVNLKVIWSIFQLINWLMTIYNSCLNWQTFIHSFIHLNFPSVIDGSNNLTWSARPTIQEWSRANNELLIRFLRSRIQVSLYILSCKIQ